MDPVSHPYLFGSGRNRYFSEETFSIHDAVSPDFNPMGHVSS
jgi:hypothetical protein